MQIKFNTRSTPWRVYHKKKQQTKTFLATGETADRCTSETGRLNETNGRFLGNEAQILDYSKISRSLFGAGSPLCKTCGAPKNRYVTSYLLRGAYLQAGTF